MGILALVMFICAVAQTYLGYNTHAVLMGIGAWSVYLACWLRDILHELRAINHNTHPYPGGLMPHKTVSKDELKEKYPDEPIHLKHMSYVEPDNYVD